jgi:hypothetical protein
MNWCERSGREYGALYAFLSAASDEGAQIRKISERFFVDGRSGADGQRRADLGDDDSNFAGGNLDPGKFLDFVEQPRHPAHARKEEVGLVTRFALKRDDVVAR